MTLDLPDAVEEKKTRAMGLLNSTSIPPEVRREERERARRIVRLERELSSTGSLETLLATEIERAATRRETGERSDPVCSCSSPTCPLKSGSVPSKLRSRSSLLATGDTLDLAAEWLQDHPGDGRSLVDAIEEWHDRRAELYEEIDLLYGTLLETRERSRRESAPTATDHDVDDVDVQAD